MELVNNLCIVFLLELEDVVFGIGEMLVKSVFLDLQLLDQFLVVSQLVIQLVKVMSLLNLMIFALLKGEVMGELFVGLFKAVDFALFVGDLNILVGEDYLFSLEGILELIK